MSTKYTEMMEAFPSLYRAVKHIGCSEGWYDLLYKLSQEIEASATASGLSPDSEEWPMATQVKEKFGGLRYYMRHVSPEIGKLVDEAQAASTSTCESCGKPGQLLTTIRHYVSVKCPDCAAAEAKAEKRPIALPGIYKPTQTIVDTKIDGKDTRVIFTSHDFADDQEGDPS